MNTLLNVAIFVIIALDFGALIWLIVDCARDLFGSSRK